MKRIIIENQNKIIGKNKDEYINIISYIKMHFYYYNGNKKISINEIMENTGTSQEKVLEIYNILKTNNKNIRKNSKGEFKLIYSDILFIDQILKQSYNSKLSIVSTFIALFAIFIPACEKIFIVLFDYISNYISISINISLIIELLFPIANIIIYFIVLNILETKNEIYFKSPINKNIKK